MRNLIRVTNSAGIGMYRCGIADDIVDSVSSHPAPEEDSKLRRVWMDIRRAEPEAWYFGFSSVQQMHDWLGRLFFSLTNYTKADACVELWLCPDEAFHEGNDQAIFLRKDCTLVKRIPYADFYKDYCDGYHHSGASSADGRYVGSSADGANIPEEVSRVS